MTYRTEVLADTPLFYARLADLNGPVVTALVGPNGTYSGTGVTYGVAGATGDNDKAASFDGNTGFFSVPLNLSGQTAVTVEFLLKTSSFPGGDRLAMEYTTNYNGSFGAFLIDPNSPSGMEFAMLDSDGYRSLFIGSRPSTGAWHHYVIAFDKASTGGITTTAWIDNVKTTTSFTASPTTHFANSTLYGMSRGGSSLFFAASMDEVAVYGGKLSDARVAVHYAAIGDSGYVLRGQTDIEDRMAGKTGYEAYLTGATACIH